MTTETTIFHQPDREWWPEHFVDEIYPAGRATPDAWIERLHDGAFVCRDDDDPETWSFSLVEGEVVEFVYCDRLPNFTVTFDAAGAPSYTEPPVSANWFWDKNEHECCGDTIDELLRNAAEFDDVEEMDVGCCHWSKGKHLFRFTALEAPPALRRHGCGPGRSMTARAFAIVVTDGVTLRTIHPAALGPGAADVERVLRTHLFGETPLAVPAHAATSTLTQREIDPTAALVVLSGPEQHEVVCCGYGDDEHALTEAAMVAGFVVRGDFVTLGGNRRQRGDYAPRPMRAPNIVDGVFPKRQGGHHDA